jgi:peptidoglycan/xylan/chitin deacetylase (PgdA/CDA1 family)
LYEFFRRQDYTVRAISLGIHDVLDVQQAKPGDVYTLKLSDFSQHLWAIEQQRVSIQTIHSRCEWREEVPVFVTFDDGTTGAYTFAAASLEERGWRGYFFITTDWIGREGFMDRRQIRDLHDRGHVIGSHSCSHPERMSHLSAEKLSREWKDSCAILRDILESPVTTASVAGGYYSRRVAEAAASAGIEVLFNSEPTSEVALVDGCLVLGRYTIQSFTKPSVSGEIAAGRCWPRWRQSIVWGTKKILKVLGGESYLTVRRQLLSHFTSR